MKFELAKRNPKRHELLPHLIGTLQRDRKRCTRQQHDKLFPAKPAGGVAAAATRARTADRASASSTRRAAEAVGSTSGLPLT